MLSLHPLAENAPETVKVAATTGYLFYTVKTEQLINPNICII
jgi:hypothetical protein